MLSAPVVIMLVMLVILLITCHWCQARKLIVNKWSVSSVSGGSDKDYESIAMV